MLIFRAQCISYAVFFSILKAEEQWERLRTLNGAGGGGGGGGGGRERVLDGRSLSTPSMSGQHYSREQLNSRTDQKKGCTAGRETCEVTKKDYIK